MRILACNSPYGQGGTGQHFAQLVEETRAEGLLQSYFCSQPKRDDDAGRVLRTPWWQRFLTNYTPVRYSPSWKSYLGNEVFDWQVARALDSPVNRFMGFAGKSLTAFRQARILGADRLELVAATSHILNVRAQHRHAQEAHGGTHWLHDREVDKTLEEYEWADRIYVHSEYVRHSFEKAGVNPDKLVRTYLRVAPRFAPPAERPADGVFRVVYVGRLDFTKGVPLLRHAFEAIPHTPKELTIVGGWGTRSMRQYIEPWVAAEDRVILAPGDPLPHLQRSDVLVHPSYQDGFGYAPMEALACGTPVIVTSDTGMKEYVNEGVNGYVIPTGSADALVDRLINLTQNSLATTKTLLPTSALKA
jgi:glycosyltransferase involved in cell wall biosynthesis